MPVADQLADRQRRRDTPGRLFVFGRKRDHSGERIAAGVQYTLIGIQSGNDPATGDIYRGLDQFGRVKDLIWVRWATRHRPVLRAAVPVRPPEPTSCAFSTATTALETASGGKTWSPRVITPDLTSRMATTGSNRLKTVNRGTLDSTQTGIVPAKGRSTSAGRSTPRELEELPGG